MMGEKVVLTKTQRKIGREQFIWLGKSSSHKDAKEKYWGRVLFLVGERKGSHRGTELTEKKRGRNASVYLGQNHTN